MPNNYPKTSALTLRIYARYVRRYPLLFLAGAAGAALAVITQGLVPPFIVAKIFSKLQIAYAHHQQLDLSDYLPYFLAYLSFMLAGVICWRGQAFAIWRLEENIQRDVANDVYDHLQAQSESFHANHFGGALVSQTNKFIGSYVRLMDSFIWNIVPSIVTVIVAISVLFFVAWPLALVMLGIVVVYLATMTWRITRQLPYNVEVAEAESEQTAALADAITNISTIRAFAGEHYESARFRKVSGRVHRRFHVLTIEVLKTEALSHFQTNSFQIVALFIGLVAVTQGGTNVSVLYLAINYSGRIVDQLWQFGRTVREINRGLGDAKEMTEILQIEPAVKDPAKPQKVKIRRGEVQFRDVGFAYPENRDDPLFKKLQLKIKPGEKVGLVGPSGGGKTTITRLLLRFMDIQNGEIAIDGQNIADVKLADLRSHISYVAQEPILFHRTLAENIGYGDQSASQQVIEGVAKMANAHEFISQLPKGYETLVGERGIKLSGGQRQRVAIARAMLKNSPILVLDEATSALDSESEVLIQDALWRLMENRTAIVIAHRLSTIQKMDRIIVLDEGKVVEEGSHKELLAKNGTYARLWAHQSGGFLEEN
ncbi:MAG TPA: ABC transporter ATP-binding protein [Candidatus Saccharimonadia bacterium]|nr:ABC transporter ATP-binding protein [Candidatus Saccharimonadia bacterium]